MRQHDDVCTCAVGRTELARVVIRIIEREHEFRTAVQAQACRIITYGGRVTAYRGHRSAHAYVTRCAHDRALRHATVVLRESGEVKGEKGKDYSSHQTYSMLSSYHHYIIPSIQQYINP